MYLNNIDIFTFANQSAEIEYVFIEAWTHQTYFVILFWIESGNMEISNQHNIKYTFICTISLIPTWNVYSIFRKKYHIIIIIIYKNKNIYLTGIILNCWNKFHGIDELPWKINLSFVSTIYLFIMWCTPKFSYVYKYMNYRLQTINFTRYTRSRVGTRV